MISRKRVHMFKGMGVRFGYFISLISHENEIIWYHVTKLFHFYARFTLCSRQPRQSR